MEEVVISEKIGKNSNGYFCRLCGKGGYKKMAQARGHLSMCPKTTRNRELTLPSADSIRDAIDSGVEENIDRILESLGEIKANRHEYGVESWRILESVVGILGACVNLEREKRDSREKLKLSLGQFHWIVSRW